MVKKDYKLKFKNKDLSQFIKNINLNHQDLHLKKPLNQYSINVNFVKIRYINEIDGL